MITFNLLPDVKLEYLKTKRLQARVIGIAVLTTIIVIGLVVLVALWVYGAQTLQKGYLTNEIQKNHAKLEAVPDLEKYLTIQNQLNSLSTLHEGKNDFSRLLKFLPGLNPEKPNNVTLTNVEVLVSEEGESMSFQGEVNDYTGLNTFRDTLTNATFKHGDTEEKLFETVTVASSSLEKSEKGGSIVVFDIATTYNPNAFLSSTKNPTIVVSPMSTTRSVQASPDVFGKSSIEKEDQ
jgi:Tfp pilus assembly protein PilN